MYDAYDAYEGYEPTDTTDDDIAAVLAEELGE